MSKEAKVGYKKNIGTILLLSFAGSIIYGLPYFRSYYYDTYQAMYHLTNTQMGLLGSAYGVLGVFSYIIGGVLADKIKAKKLLIFSMIATGLGGLLHLFVNNFYALVVIYGLWGVTSLLTFWPALMKIVRIQATEEEQSRAYGTFEGGLGVFNAAHLAVATAIFGIFQRKAMPTLGIKGIIWFYSLAPLIVGIIFIFLLKEPETVKEDGTSSTVSFKDIIRVLKMPVMWLIIIMMYTSYTFNMSSYYFTPYASNIIGVTAVIAAILTVMSQYIRPFAATLGGFSGDKFGRSHTMIVGYIFLAILSYKLNFAVPVITPIALQLVTMIFGYSRKFIVEARNKEKIKDAMGKYISQDIMQNVVNNIDNVKLGGKKANVTVLFADIRGFTSMSEKLEPDEISVILNEYFTALEPIISSYNGVINKFIGDAIMAIFGEPIQDKDHAVNAVKCADAMLKKVQELQKKWLEEGKPKIEIGVGINTGEAFVGNIGSEKRLEYTVIGDMVNLASRIESYNKVYKTQFLISSFTYQYVRGIADVIKISEVKIRGKEKKMNIYEVLRLT